MSFEDGVALARDCMDREDAGDETGADDLAALNDILEEAGLDAERVVTAAYFKK